MVLIRGFDVLTRNAVHTNPIVCQHGLDVQQILAEPNLEQWARVTRGQNVRP